MSHPIVSIIIPIYNSEATLERCIKSIQAQTHTDWEAICVNDGSPDNCGQMLDEYAKIDSRIKPIHKDNGGVASARQTGIEAAQGDYAIHCDPDDWIEPNMLEVLVHEAERTNAGMIICDYFIDYNGATKQINQRPTGLTSNQVEINLFQHLHGSCCNKLISSAYYKQESFIPGLNLSEDLLYICKILRHEPKIAYLPTAFYHYVLSEEGSMTTTYTSERFYQLSKIFHELLSIYNENKHMVDLIRNTSTLSLGWAGANVKSLKSKELRQELGMGCAKRILSSNTSTFRKAVILLAALYHPLASCLLSLKSKINR